MEKYFNNYRNQCHEARKQALIEKATQQIEWLKQHPEIGSVVLNYDDDDDVND